MKPSKSEFGTNFSYQAACARRYAAIRHLPLAKDLVRASRQQLVAHLDTYSKRHPALFRDVRGPVS